MRITKTWMAVCLVGALSFGFASCGGDDDDEVEQPKVVNPDDDTPDDNGTDNKPAGDKSPSWVKAVDLGLSVKWASCNIGAKSENAYGDYFAWGEVSKKSRYNKDTYQHYDMNKSAWVNIGREIWGTDYDVAHVQWAGKWRMPLASECRELIEKCTVQETTMGGVKVVRFTAPNGNSIVLPQAGYYDGSSTNMAGTQCCYWTGSASDSNSPYVLLAVHEASVVVWGALAFRGLTVRAVSE